MRKTAFRKKTVESISLVEMVISLIRLIWFDIFFLNFCLIIFLPCTRKMWAYSTRHCREQEAWLWFFSWEGNPENIPVQAPFPTADFSLSRRVGECLQLLEHHDWTVIEVSLVIFCYLLLVKHQFIIFTGKKSFWLIFHFANSFWAIILFCFDILKIEEF